MKKMTLTRRLILSGALVSALAMGLLVLGVGLSVRNTPGPLGDSLSPGIALAAAAADLPGTFDSQLAGLSAYLDLGSPIDLEVVESMSTAVYEKRSTYILIAISGIILYAEQGGWLVAYGGSWRYLQRGILVSPERHLQAHSSQQGPAVHHPGVRGGHPGARLDCFQHERYLHPFQLSLGDEDGRLLKRHIQL